MTAIQEAPTREQEIEEMRAALKHIKELLNIILNGYNDAIVNASQLRLEKPRETEPI